MLANLRRKHGLTSGINTPAPTMMPPHGLDFVVSPTGFIDPALPPPFTMEELGFVWNSGERGGGVVSPSAIPLWLQEQASTSVPQESMYNDLASIVHNGLGSPY